ncbi:hypothetical protein FB451DRAFT_1177198 [Mycena latifolia]|nr:hypothetical protein FB451DRAFT_1177198 [Mycena latifolia]
MSSWTGCTQALDSARFRLALATFPNIFRCGGWVPLAATHYHFIREIPMLSRYEVRASIGAWDDKWIWVISRFVKPASRSTRPTPAADSKTPTNPLVATLKTPATPLLETPAAATPSGVSTPAAMEPEVSKALLARGARELEPDGSLLYTVCVSQLCFKVGRLTVPPAVVLAANGFYAHATSSAPTSTAPAPPPYWPATHRTRTFMPLLKAFYAGGWRAERWWEGAFAACEGRGGRGCARSSARWTRTGREKGGVEGEKGGGEALRAGWRG